jgi:hypothetical protein
VTAIEIYHTLRTALQREEPVDTAVESLDGRRTADEVGELVIRAVKLLHPFREDNTN